MGRSDGQRRRSPRISALDATCKENQQKPQLSGTRTCRRLKRKFHDAQPNYTSVSKLASKQVWKGRESPQDHANHSADCVEWRSVASRESKMVQEKQNPDDIRATTNGKAAIMPAKHILELVLDTLQRRDTYEVFAEPVDPDEVEDYYEIIKEPMDFGTMRAKLHEGMYENLEQFEHDVFLIPENAMQFNSSATIYFRQARAIHELAKKVIHALKTDPENFVLEFSGTRRRSMRKALSDTKDSRFSLSKSGTVGNEVSSKRTVNSPSTSTFRRTSKKNPGGTGKADSFCARNLLNGSKDGRLSSSKAADRRSTYCGWGPSFFNEKDSLDSKLYNSSKALVLMKQGDISYKDSLMSFVKDLGPIAQMVAKRKLLEQQGSNGDIQTEKCQISSAATQRKPNAFRTFRDFAPGCHPFLKVCNIIDLTDDGEEENGSRDMKASYGTSGKEESGCWTTPRKERNNCGRGTTPGKEKIDSTSPVTLTTCRGSEPSGHTVAKKVGVTRNPVARDYLNCSASKSNNISYRDDNVRPVILALETSHFNVAEFKSRNKKSSVIPSSWKKPRPGLGSCGEAAAAVSSSSSLAQQTQPLPLNSKFTFDLPFLKARLNQMNALETGGELLKKRPSFEKGGLNCACQAEPIGINPFLYNQSGPSLDKLDTDLVLQL